MPIAFGGIFFFLGILVLLAIAIWFIVASLRGASEVVDEDPPASDHQEPEAPSLLEDDLSFAGRQREGDVR